jgi:Ca2+-binding EF-hand superfamily protein
LFNEESKYCVLPKKYREFHLLLDTNHDGVISQQEITDAVNILAKAKQQQTAQTRNNIYNHFERYK